MDNYPGTQGLHCPGFPRPRLLLDALVRVGCDGLIPSIVDSCTRGARLELLRGQAGGSVLPGGTVDQESHRERHG
jgi:hypothetical protein